MNIYNNEWRIRHIRIPCFFSPDGYKRGGITLQYKVDEWGIEYTYSICSPKDNYSRKLGLEHGQCRGDYPAVLQGNFYGHSRSDVEVVILKDLVESLCGVISKDTQGLIYDFIAAYQQRELHKLIYGTNP